LTQISGSENFIIEKLNILLLSGFSWLDEARGSGHESYFGRLDLILLLQKLSLDHYTEGHSAAAN